MLRFGKQSRANIFQEMTNDPSDPSYLKKFSHIDYRNCECDSVVSHLFWRLRRHIEKSGKLIYFIKLFYKNNSIILSEDSMIRKILYNQAIIISLFY